jgi:hypothetical protein
VHGPQLFAGGCAGVLCMLGVQGQSNGEVAAERDEGSSEHQGS